MLGVSQPKWKCPLKQQEERAFLGSQGQVLQATASVINELEMKMWSSCWGFPAGFPLQECRWLYWNRGKINNPWNEREESVLRKSEDG